MNYCSMSTDKRPYNISIKITQIRTIKFVNVLLTLSNLKKSTTSCDTSTNKSTIDKEDKKATHCKKRCLMYMVYEEENQEPP